MNNIKINETLHLVNFNNYLSKNEFIAECFESMKKYSPYEIKVWTEKDDFVKAVFSKKSKFLTYINRYKKGATQMFDYLRLHILYKYGGIYSELDMPMFKKLNINSEDEFLFYYEAFHTAFGPMKINKGNKLLKFFIDFLDNDFEPSMLYDYEGSLFNVYRFSEELKNNDFANLIRKSNNFHNKNETPWVSHLPGFFDELYTIAITDDMNIVKKYINSPYLMLILINDKSSIGLRAKSWNYHQIMNNEEGKDILNSWLHIIAPRVKMMINLTDINFNFVPAKLNSDKLETLLIKTQ